MTEHCTSLHAVKAENDIQSNRSARALWRLVRNKYRIKTLLGGMLTHRGTSLSDLDTQLATRKFRKSRSIFTQILMQRDVHKSTRTLTALQFFLNQTLIPAIKFYCAIIIPYRLAFQKYYHTWVYFDIGLDLFLIIYYTIRYLAERFKSLADPQTQPSISFRWPYVGFKHFFFWQFLIFIMLSVPWEMMSKELIVIKFFHLLWLKDAGMISRRLFCQNRWSNKMLLKSRILRPLRRLFVSLLITLNVMTCCWILLSKTRENSWIHQHDSTAEADIYIEALLFMTERVSSVGFGEVVPDSVLEYFSIMILQFIATYFYAQFFHQLASASDKFETVDNPGRKEQYDLLSWTIKLTKINKRKAYMTSKFLADLANFYFEGKSFNIQEKTIKDGNYVSLPFEIQSQLIQRLFGDIFTVFSRFFEGLTEEFRNALVTEMLPFTTSEALFGENHQCYAVYFVREGTIREILSKDGTEVKLHRPGSVLGYNYILLNKKPRMIYKPDGIASGFCIPKSAFISLTKVQFKNMMVLKKRAMATFIKKFQRAKTAAKAKFLKISSMPDTEYFKPRKFDNFPSICNHMKSIEINEIYQELPLNCQRESQAETPRSSARISLTPYDQMLGSTMRTIEDIPCIMNRSIWPDSSPNRNLFDSGRTKYFSEQRPSTTRPLLKLSESSHPTVRQEESFILEALDSEQNQNLGSQQHIQNQSGIQKISQNLTPILIKVNSEKGMQFSNSVGKPIVQKRYFFQKFDTNPTKINNQLSPGLNYGNSLGLPRALNSIPTGGKETVSQLVDEDLVEEEGEPESDSDSDELNSSLEIPIESIRDDEMLFDSQLFDLNGICVNLEGKKIEVEQKFRKMLSKLKELSSQARKASAYATRTYQ